MVSDRPLDDDVDGAKAPEDTSALADVMAAVEAHEANEASPAKEGDEATPRKKEAAAEGSAAPKVSNEAALPEAEASKPDAKGAPDPLATWKQADRERFKELPPEMQEFVLRRERERNAEFDRKSADIATFKREYGAIDEMFQPYRAQMERAGTSPYQIFQAWRNVEQALMDGRGEQVIRDIAKAYNLDLGKIAGANVSRETAPAQPNEGERELQALLDPFVSPLKAELEAMKGELAKAQQFQTSLTQTQESQNFHRIQKDILDFANAKDSAGNPAHPYFGDVQDEMGYIALAYKQRGQAVPSLQELYDYAVWANTSTRERLLAQRNSAATTKPTDEARAKATAARKAGSSVTGAPRGGQLRNGRDEGRSVREAIEAAVEELDVR